MKNMMELISRNRKLDKFVRDNKDLIIKVGAILLTVVLAFALFMFKSDEGEEVEAEESITAEETQAASIFVDIGGEVMTPTVAELPEGSRVADAIEAAGGLTDKADLTEINRAAFISDGEKIFVPSVDGQDGYGTDASGGTSGNGDMSGGSYSSGGKININTADSQQLQQLTGVGPATAEKIIAYRNENGRFKSIEDIKNVSGIGDKTFEKFKNSIKV